MELKIKNKEELKAIAVDVLKRYPKAQKVAVTSDGEAFITDEGDNAVKNHAKNNRYKKELEIVNFTRDGLEAAKAAKAEKAEVLIAAVKAAETLEVLESIKATEASLEKPRKSVLDAIEARIIELTPAE